MGPPSGADVPAGSLAEPQRQSHSTAATAQPVLVPVSESLRAVVQPHTMSASTGETPPVASTSSVPASLPLPISAASAGGAKLSPTPAPAVATSAAAAAPAPASSASTSKAGTKRSAPITSLPPLDRSGRNLSEKKIRRLEKNRLSARECRRKKKEAALNMEREINLLEAENLRLRLQLQVSAMPIK